jgi:hypothetical protein
MVAKIVICALGLSRDFGFVAFFANLSEKRSKKKTAKLSLS